MPNELPDELRRSRNLVVEVDAMPSGYVCSASMKGALGTTDVKKVAAGDRPIRKLYSRNSARSSRPTRRLESALMIWRFSDRSRCSR